MKIKSFTKIISGILCAALAMQIGWGVTIEKVNAAGKLIPVSYGETRSTLSITTDSADPIDFYIGTNEDGKVEKDINSLHTYSDDISYNFTKNRVIRVLDTIASDIKSMWENTFLGLVSNNTDGRDLFKASLINYLKELNDKGAIQEFKGASDVEVSQGENIDSVVATITVKPVDSMEYLYLTINVVE